MFITVERATHKNGKLLAWSDDSYIIYRVAPVLSREKTFLNSVSSSTHHRFRISYPIVEEAHTQKKNASRQTSIWHCGEPVPFPKLFNLTDVVAIIDCFWVFFWARALFLTSNQPIQSFRWNPGLFRCYHRQADGKFSKLAIIILTMKFKRDSTSTCLWSYSGGFYQSFAFSRVRGGPESNLTVIETGQLQGQGCSCLMDTCPIASRSPESLLVLLFANENGSFNQSSCWAHFVNQTSLLKRIDKQIGQPCH